MTKLSIPAPFAVIMPFVLALAACGSEPTDAGAENQADTFAARIKGASPAPTQTPRIAEPLPGAAPGPYVPGTATDPQSKACNAPAMGPYLGRAADDATRAEIMEVIGGANEVRFIQAGSSYIEPDPTNPRLNLMLDQQNIIRDARCG